MHILWSDASNSLLSSIRPLSHTHTHRLLCIFEVFLCCHTPGRNERLIIRFDKNSETRRAESAGCCGFGGKAGYPLIKGLPVGYTSPCLRLLGKNCLKIDLAIRVWINTECGDAVAATVAAGLSVKRANVTDAGKGSEKSDKTFRRLSLYSTSNGPKSQNTKDKVQGAAVQRRCTGVRFKFTWKCNVTLRSIYRGFLSWEWPNYQRSTYEVGTKNIGMITILALNNLRGYH